MRKSTMDPCCYPSNQGRCVQPPLTPSPARLGLAPAQWTSPIASAVINSKCVRGVLSRAHRSAGARHRRTLRTLTATPRTDNSALDPVVGCTRPRRSLEPRAPSAVAASRVPRVPATRGRERAGNRSVSPGDRANRRAMHHVQACGGPPVSARSERDRRHAATLAPPVYAPRHRLELRGPALELTRLRRLCSHPGPRLD
jgi:hypothetical protein